MKSSILRRELASMILSFYAYRYGIDNLPPFIPNENMHTFRPDGKKKQLMHINIKPKATLKRSSVKTIFIYPKH